MRKIGEENLYSRYTNVTAKEKEEAAYLDNLIVDIAQQSRSTTASQAPSSLNPSKSKQQTAPESKTKMIDTTDRRKPILPQKFTVSLIFSNLFIIICCIQSSQMLTRKQVTSEQSTAIASKTDKSMPVDSGLRKILRAKRQVTTGNASSMMSLLKTRDNQGQGAAAKTKRPVMFGSIGAGKK